jgi:hypothetical protein
VLEAAYHANSSFVPFLDVDARLDELRSDARFHALQRRLKFPARVRET